MERFSKMGDALNWMPLRMKLGTLALVPLLGMSWFAAGTAIERQNDANETGDLERLIDLSVAVGNLVHEAQKERGATAVYISAEGEQSIEELSARWRTTDLRVTGLTEFLDRHAAELPSNVRDALDPAMEVVELLDSIRLEISSLDIGAAEAMEYYTDLNSMLLASVASVGTSATNAELSQGAVAYLAFLRGKEDAGRGRAHLARVFSTDRFDPGVHDLVSSLVANEVAFQQIYVDLATLEMRTLFSDRQDHPAAASMNEMLDTALSGEPPFGVDPIVWFETATERINLLKEVEDAQTAYILDLSSTLSAEAESAFRESVAIAVVFVIITLILAVMIGLSIARPVRLIGEQAARITSGDLGVHLEPCQDLHRLPGARTLAPR